MLNDPRVTILGPYTAGETPEPWIHTFEDNTGAVISLAGFTVCKVSYRLDGGSTVVLDGAIVGNTAKVIWQVANFAVAGEMKGEMWISNGANHFARAFGCRIRVPQGGASPLP